jgi:hypothetical protein
MGTMARWFLLLLSGCSLAISGPSPDRPRNKPPTCDTSKGLVALDAVVAATMSVIALSLATGNNGGEAVAPVLVGGIFAASAIHGNNAVNACNREQANYESEMAANRTPAGPEEPPLPPERPSLPPDRPDLRIAAPGAGRIAMQPAVSLPSASGPLPPQQLAPPQQPVQQQQPQPQPQPPQQQPAPAKAAAASPAADEPWPAFWKEVP